MHWRYGIGIDDGAGLSAVILCSISDLLILYLIIGGVANDYYD